jgi:spore coat protein CotF
MQNQSQNIDSAQNVQEEIIVQNNNNNNEMQDQGMEPQEEQNTFDMAAPMQDTQEVVMEQVDEPAPTLEHDSFVSNFFEGEWDHQHVDATTQDTISIDPTVTMRPEDLFGQETNDQPAGADEYIMDDGWA